MNSIFQIDNYHELMSLHKLLMERHYLTEFNSNELIGSKHIADLSNRVLDRFIEIDEEQKRFDKVNSWQNWRVLDPSRPEWNMLLSRIKNIGQWWQKHSLEERKAYVSIFLSPYTVSSEHMEELLDYGNRNNG